MKKLSKRLAENIAVVIYIATAIFLFSQQTTACEWDYPIWQVRSKNADPLYRFIKGEKSGYIDQTGKVVIKPALSFYGNSGDEFFDGLLLTGVGSGAYVNKNGKITLDTKYYRNWDFSEGLAVAMKEDNEKWGFIDRTGKFVISPRFESSPNGYVDSFSDGMAMIKVDEKYGYIDRSGEFVIQPKFLKGNSFQEGLARVIVEGPCMRFDHEQPCDSAETLGEKGERQISACKYAFIDKTGSVISAERFDNAKDFSEDLAAILKGDKWGYIDKQGKVIIEPQYDKAESFSDGLARVQQGKLWGYINQTGKFVISPQFENAEDFANGLAPVGEWNEKEREYDNYHYINKKGQTAFAGKFKEASHYFKGLAHVKLSNIKDDDYYLNGKYAYINVKGEKIFTYEQTSSDEDQFFLS